MPTLTDGGSVPSFRMLDEIQNPSDALHELR
jgi:hypothetical protein